MVKLIMCREMANSVVAVDGSRQRNVDGKNDNNHGHSKSHGAVRKMFNANSAISMDTTNKIAMLGSERKPKIKARMMQRISPEAQL